MRSRLVLLGASWKEGGNGEALEWQCSELKMEKLLG